MSKFLYLRIYHRYGCCIYPSAKVGKGFLIAHLVGIVIGDCTIGEDFRIYQNCTIGTRNFNEVKKKSPVIGNNVVLASNSLILGGVTIVDDVVVGANSLVVKDIDKSGTYVGSPIVRLY